MKFLIILITALLALGCGAPTQVLPTLTPTTQPTNTHAALPTISDPVFSPTSTPAPEPSPTPSPTPTPNVTVPVISIGDTQFTVDVADTGAERSQGLSGRPGLDPGTGMLFVFESPGAYTFWMIEMQFPLDFVWISADCTVADLTEDVPPQMPGQAPRDLPRYRPSVPVQYVLEINAGEIESLGISSGDPVAFQADLAGKYGC